jgi:CRISPR-associated protein Cas2
MHYLIAYDIETQTSAGRRRLARVAQTCERCGQRVQQSVFEVRLDRTRMARLQNELLQTIEPKLDSVFIYTLAGPSEVSRTTLGLGPNREMGQPWIL